MKKLLFLFVVAQLFGCVNEPASTAQVGNIKLDLLFEKDGYKIYRFNDGGRYIYWATGGSITSPN